MKTLRYIVGITLACSALLFLVGAFVMATGSSGDGSANGLAMVFSFLISISLWQLSLMCFSSVYSDRIGARDRAEILNKS